jgi:hypothetical protein
VHTRPSPAIQYLKFIWGLHGQIKDVRDYVVDAFVIAASSGPMMSRIAKYNKYKKYLAQAKGVKEPPRPDMPSPSFKDDVVAAASAVLVSKTSVGKTTGCAHAEQLLGIRKGDGIEFEVVKRVDLKSLTLKNIEDMVDKETANRGLYLLLKEKLLATVTTKQRKTPKGKLKEFEAADADLAFAEDVYHHGTIVRKVRCYNGRSRGLQLRGGLALNKDNIRSVNFYRYGGRMHMRPNYTAQLAKKRLGGKCEGLDVPIGPSFEHVQRLMKYDYVEFFMKKGDASTTCAGYFLGVQPVTGQVHILPHEETVVEKRQTVCLSLVTDVKKYYVDYFGGRFLIV